MKVYFELPSYDFRSLSKRDVKEVATEFEAVLLKQVLKEGMRPLLRNKSFYQRMYYDSFMEAVSRKLAEAGGVGIAEFILKQLEHNKNQKP